VTKEVPKPTFYAWVVLFLIILMSICNQWQRYVIGYAYGFKHDKVGNTTDAHYEIKTAYDPEMKTYYGLLSGLAFSLSFATMGIFAGFLSDRLNRKALAAICCICWSTTTFLSGIIPSFWIFFLMRFLLGLFEAPFNPCAYSIISDYFHPQYRTTANSLFNGAIYLGGALSSLGILMIGEVGWRATYDIIGVCGMIAGVIGFIFILEPTRGKFTPVKPESELA
jgi:MFS family permease